MDIPFIDEYMGRRNEKYALEGRAADVLYGSPDVRRRMKK